MGELKQLESRNPAARVSPTYYWLGMGKIIFDVLYAGNAAFCNLKGGTRAAH